MMQGAYASSEVVVPEARVGACYRHGLETFFSNLPVLLGTGLVVGCVWLGGASMTHVHGVIGLLGLAFGALVTTPLLWGFYYMCLQGVRGRRPEVEDLVVKVHGSYGQIALAGVAVCLLVFAGLLLLVVPGVIAYARTRFVPYLVLEDGMDAATAIRESFELTRGREGTILGISALGLLACGVGSLFMGIGVLPAAVWWDLAMASLYHAEVVPEETPPRLADLFPDPLFRDL